MSLAPTQLAPRPARAASAPAGGEARAPRGSARVAERAPARRLAVAGVRRTCDVLVAGVLLVALAPLLAALALAVRLDSPGPALFRQRRVGRGQREFTLLKFRTMDADADAAPHRAYVQTLIGDARASACGHLYKLSVDDRVTRLGRRLRAWSLDELPQLLNVLRGEMSLVGPRPVIPYEVACYPDSYLARFAVKPGLTGLWQVSGRSERTYDEMVRFDVEYAAADSLWLDLRILVRTVPVVLGRRGVA